jgi:hypothetical protein
LLLTENYIVVEIENHKKVKLLFQFTIGT